MSNPLPTTSPHNVASTTLRNETFCVDSLPELLRLLVRGENLSHAQAAKLLISILEESATDAQIAAVLVSLAVKGETADELAAMAEVMRSLAVRLNPGHAKFIDTAGTGASRAKVFNVSTAAAFVIAGAGLPVAKHGGRAATSQSGSADAFTALGVNVTTQPEVAQRCLNDIGICFMFAPLYHGATARVAAIRREIAVPTTFNLLGPLTNPAGAAYQIIGVWKQSLMRPVAEALLALGTTRAWVVHGSDGLDEVTLAGTTLVTEAFEGTIREFEVRPEDFGLHASSITALRQRDAASSASLILEILQGARHDEARDIVVLNAAAALFVGGVAPGLKEAAHMAQKSIDNGAALERLTQLVRVTNE